MINRIISERLHLLLESFPAVLLLGPRQVGKTTLVRSVFAESKYLDLENPQVHQLVNSDILHHLTNGRKEGPIIIDEAQVIPEIFPALRSIIDQKRKKKGQYILLGSAQPALIKSISESLAGRIGILELDPLIMQELSSDFSYKQLWLNGGFPDAFMGDFRQWWDAYLRTFIERDLAIWGINTDPILLRRLLTMLAHNQGSTTNSSHLGKSLGVTYHTVNRYLKILENTFIIRVLPPFFKNIKKRLVKSPKIYIRDTGLLHHLLNINSIEELESHPIIGKSWETFVIEEMIRKERIKNPFTQYFFWRTQVGAEADLILERGDQIFAIEIKSGSSIKANHISKLKQILKDIGSSSGTIVNQSEESNQASEQINIQGFLKDFNWIP